MLYGSRDKDGLPAITLLARRQACCIDHVTRITDGEGLLGAASLRRPVGGHAPVGGRLSSICYCNGLL